MIIILIGLNVNVYAGSDDDKFDWMNADVKSMDSAISSCLDPPQFTSITNGDVSLNIDNSGKWIATGSYVEEDKLLQIKWSTDKLKSRPTKYKLLYRIDPRFKKPQLFIQKYDYSQKRYLSDFYQYKNGQLLKYQDTPEMVYSQRIKNYTDYFNFKGREKIPVQEGDVINVTIDNSKYYFGSDSQMQKELGYGDNPVVIYTDTSLEDNRIIYTNTDRWCNDVITSADDYAKYCIPYANYYRDVQINFKTLEGVVENKYFNKNQQNISACSDSANGKDNNPLCYYDQGRGMEIKLGGTTIKPIEEKFAYSPFSNKNFFYYKSDANGGLDFTSSWSIDGMYSTQTQFMENFDKYNGESINDYVKLESIITSSSEFFMNFLHFGRYLMHVEIGHSSGSISEEDLDKIKVEYVILKDSVADDSTSGTSVDQNFRGNADKSGYLWMRVVAPDDAITGNIEVNTANYTGSTWFSDVVYGDLVKPLREKFNELSKIIYFKLIKNPTLQNIARTALTLYVIIYGLMFLAGATQITVTNIVVRTIKIAIVVALFSDTSWSFFNSNLFDVFVSGTDYLLTSVVGVTGRVDNVFSFIDPIFDKYTNPRTWGVIVYTITTTF
ncbi:type IV secretion system protein [Rickettsiaceae bacterium]|nr:type IV secretion system protein [Rickettsiaceae bacterium]